MRPSADFPVTELELRLDRAPPRTVGGLCCLFVRVLGRVDSEVNLRPTVGGLK